MLVLRLILLKLLEVEKKLNTINKFCLWTGLHPLVAILMIILDNMLFASGGLVISWPISIPIGITTTIICVLIQKNAMREQWGLAIGKSMFVGFTDSYSYRAAFNYHCNWRSALEQCLSLLIMEALPWTRRTSKSHRSTVWGNSIMHGHKL